jgi:cobyrinic acid a,c-diamide synthase
VAARLIIAAPASGSGKTTLTAGLIGALRRRGLVVQPFKCGPDYIDPGYHALAAGRPCRNLDTWLLGRDATHWLFAHAGAGADLALIEGVMGLFDGFGALDDTGSTADVARLLEAPVVLAIDARGMARSAAALVDGFLRFDQHVRIGGVLLNRVGSARHAELCATAIAAHTGLPCFGYLPRRDELRLPERHLGLVTTVEAGPWATMLERVADTLAETCDLDGLLALARSAPTADILPPAPFAPPSARRDQPGPLIAVAQDQAFSFTYPETRELLEAAGARVVSFSPMADPQLPPETAGVILSGGFPELYAEPLSRNTALHSALRAAHAAGLPIYAECGGLMYLTEALVDQQGRRWPMVGLLPGQSVMTERLTLGYRTVRVQQDGPLLSQGASVRGHEFHYSRWEGRPDRLQPAYTILPPSGDAGPPEGAQLGSLIASYIHLHWLVQPDIAQCFVQSCTDALQGYATSRTHPQVSQIVQVEGT